MNIKYCAFLTSALFIGAVQASANTVIYTNGAISGASTDGGWTIDGSYSISDSFTVSETATLDSADIGLWTFPVDVPAALDWSIGTTPFGSDVASGGGPLDNTQVGVGFGYFAVWSSTFALDATVNPGTYFLTLQDAVTSGGPPVLWDVNNGSSTAYGNGIGNLAGLYGQTSNSESFTIYGTPVVDRDLDPVGSSAAPDMGSTLSLLGFGLGVLAFLKRRVSR